MMAALAALLIGPLAIKIMSWGYFKNISFGVVPVIFMGMALGPFWGAGVGAAADVLGFILFPMGAYNPAFTLTYALIGCIPGLLIRGKEPKFIRVLIATLITHVICSVGLNTAILVFMMGLSPEIMIWRAVASCGLIPLYSLLIHQALRTLPRIVRT